MLKLNAALESLSTVVEEDLDKELEAGFQALPEAELEMVIAKIEMDEVARSLEATYETITDLENLSASIEEFGICAATMKLIDPAEELRSIVSMPAYEDLPANLEINEVSMSVAEDVKKTVTRIWNQFMEFLKGLASKMKAWFQQSTANLMVISKLADVLSKKYKDAKVNVITWKSTEVDGMSSSNLDAWFKAVNVLSEDALKGVDTLIGIMAAAAKDGSGMAANKSKLVAALNTLATAFNKSGNVPGRMMTVGSNITDFTLKPVKSPEKGKVKLGEMFGDPAGCSKTLGELSGRLTVAKNLSKVSGDFDKMLKAETDLIKASIKGLDKDSKDKIDDKKALISAGKHVAALCSSILSTMVSELASTSKDIVKAAKAGLSAKEAKNEGDINTDDNNTDDSTDDVTLETATTALEAAATALETAKTALEADDENEELIAAHTEAETAHTEATELVASFKTDEDEE